MLYHYPGGEKHLYKIEHSDRRDRDISEDRPSFEERANYDARRNNDDRN